MEATQEKALQNIVVIHHTGNDSMNHENCWKDLVFLTLFSDCGFTYHTDEGLKEKMKARHPNLAVEVDLLCWDTFGSSDRYVSKKQIVITKCMTSPVALCVLIFCGLPGWKKVSGKIYSF